MWSGARFPGPPNKQYLWIHCVDSRSYMLASCKVSVVYSQLWLLVFVLWHSAPILKKMKSLPKAPDILREMESHRRIFNSTLHTNSRRDKSYISGYIHWGRKKSSPPLTFERTKLSMSAKIQVKGTTFWHKEDCGHVA